MELFTLSILPSEAGKLIAELKKYAEGTALEIYSEATSCGSRVNCHVSVADDTEPAPDFWFSLASMALSEFMIREKEADWLERLIRREFDYDSPEDIRTIRHFCTQVLEDSEANGGREGKWSVRKQKIAEEVHAYLTDNRFMIVDGFVRFRLQAYMDALREVVEYAVDEFILDRQYQEFIALLKYFVHVQETKIPLVHLIHKGNYDFVLLDERLKPIETRQMEGFVLEMIEQDLNYEDMIISTLITVSPGHLCIHTPESETQVIKTIAQIFEGRTEICNQCAVCRSMLEACFPKEPKSNPLYP